VDQVLDATGEERDVAVARAGAALREGEIVVLPTDTFYGVAADAFNPRGTRRIFEAKGHPRSIPLPILLRSPKQLPGVCPALPDGAEALMAAYWPGPLTIVVPAQTGLRWDLGDNEGTVAVRMPLDEVALAVIRDVGPLAVTGANRSGEPPPTTVEQAREQLGALVRHYLDGGPRDARTASTIVALTRREPAVLREGAVPGEDALDVARGELDPLDAAARLDDRDADEGRDPSDERDESH
jgi:L-threonylcarbamoyladenylate synthase